MSRFDSQEDLPDLEQLLQQQPPLGSARQAGPKARAGLGTGVGERFGALSRPRRLQTDPQGRELLARTRRGLERRQRAELGELLYQGCLIGMMALPLSVTQVCWSEMPGDHQLQIARRARRELSRGHGPGLVRDVLRGLEVQSDRFSADPVMICKASIACGFHYHAYLLLAVVLRMCHRYQEALEVIDELEAQPLSLTQQANCQCNRAFILVCTERKGEAHACNLRAAQLSEEAHMEINVLLGELMRGSEEGAIASAARMERKLSENDSRAEQAIAILVKQMKSPFWEATPEDVQRVNAIKLKLKGMPALIADILSTISIKPTRVSGTPGPSPVDVEGASSQSGAIREESHGEECITREDQGVMPESLGALEPPAAKKKEKS